MYLAEAELENIHFKLIATWYLIFLLLFYHSITKKIQAFKHKEISFIQYYQPYKRNVLSVSMILFIIFNR